MNWLSNIQSLNTLADHVHARLIFTVVLLDYAYRHFCRCFLLGLLSCRLDRVGPLKAIPEDVMLMIELKVLWASGALPSGLGLGLEGLINYG